MPRDKVAKTVKQSIIDETANHERCTNCHGRGYLKLDTKFKPLTFIIAEDQYEPIIKELARLDELLDTQTANAPVRRGQALYWMSVLSAQTPAESLA